MKNSYSLPLVLTHNSSHHKVSYSPLFLLTFYLEFCVQVNHLFLAVLPKGNPLICKQRESERIIKVKWGLLWKRDPLYGHEVSVGAERLKGGLRSWVMYDTSLRACWYFSIASGIIFPAHLSNTLVLWLHPFPNTQSEPASSKTPSLQFCSPYSCSLSQPPESEMFAFFFFKLLLSLACALSPTVPGRSPLAEVCKNHSSSVLRSAFLSPSLLGSSIGQVLPAT